MEQSFKKTIIQLDPKNKKCADCGDGDIQYVSVNNGITLCELCADVHKSLGNQISYIRKLDDEFDDYLKKYFLFGGNKKFRSKLKSLGINFDTKRLSLYRTYGCDYYRRYLKAKVLENPKPPKDYKNPNEVMAIDSHSFPEFEDYVLKKDTENLADNKIINDMHNYAFSNDDDIKRPMSVENRSNKIKENLNDCFNLEPQTEDLKRVPIKKYENCDDCFNENENNLHHKKNFLRKSLNKIKKVGVYIKKEGSKGYGIIKKASKVFSDKYQPGKKVKTAAKFFGKQINKLPGMHHHENNEINNLRVQYGNDGKKEDDKDESQLNNIKNNNVEQLDFV